MLIFDVFPATVTVPGGRFAKARAALTDAGRLVVWVEPPSGSEPPIAWDVQASGEASRVPAGRRTEWTIPTEAGDVVVNQAGGCGCGSKLRGLRATQLLSAMSDA